MFVAGYTVARRLVKGGDMAFTETRLPLFVVVVQNHIIAECETLEDAIQHATLYVAADIYQLVGRHVYVARKENEC